MTWITIEILLYSPTSKDKAYEAVYGNCKNKKLVKTSTNILAAKQKEKQLLEEYEKEKKKKKITVSILFIVMIQIRIHQNVKINNTLLMVGAMILELKP